MLTPDERLKLAFDFANRAARNLSQQLHGYLALRRIARWRKVMPRPRRLHVGGPRADR